MTDIFTTTKPRGYMSLITAVILITVIAGVSLALALGSLFSRYNSSIFAAKKTTRYLAESCIQTALYGLAASSTYSGNETVGVGSSTCKVYPLATEGENYIIQTSASSSDGFSTNLKLTVTQESLRKVSLKELVTF